MSYIWGLDGFRVRPYLYTRSKGANQMKLTQVDVRMLRDARREAGGFGVFVGRTAIRAANAWDAVPERLQHALGAVWYLGLAYAVWCFLHYGMGRF